ncbi:PREDICTED: inactive kinase [Prunus dulcis]|uniref:PREDICTED: inactive kinase n=1 Tax=Prunus dulcis TaxID=3755 RepID=A0A5E4ERB2_PRUDU|nr:PREDICTED: inactive kinase [Prunus dulcis]
MEESSHRSNDNSKASTTKALLEKFSKLDRDAGIGMPNYRADMEFSGNLREAISLSRNGPPGPPPLCSICQHKAPVFGRKKRRSEKLWKHEWLKYGTCSEELFGGQYQYFHAALNLLKTVDILKLLSDAV